jgi:hypothetical protein
MCVTLCDNEILSRFWHSEVEKIHFLNHDFA